MYQPMHSSSFLVDTDQKIFCLRLFSLLPDIHLSIIYAYHRKYLNITNDWKLV